MSVTVAAPGVSTARKARLMSLDVFRGFTVMMMIVVNNGGTQSFAPLLHSEWNGWTMTDLVFPFFLFITGVSLTLSFAARKASDGSRADLLPHILRRTALIFFLGLLINGFPHYHLTTLRYVGVLQRIALCYLAGSVLYLWTGTRTRWGVIAGLLVGYWLLMRFVPVPGFGVPGVDVPLLDPDRNMVAWLDRKVMMGHLYEKVRDPEGILSTLPAIANTLFGVAVGEWIRGMREDSGRLMRRLVAVGASCFVAGEIWNLTFPINKKLWTSSYVLLTVGLAMLALAACYWLADVKRWRGRWTTIPAVFGTNTIFAYAFSEFVAIAFVAFKFRLHDRVMNVKDVVNWYAFDNIPNAQWSALGYPVAFAAFCWVCTWLLYRKKIFLKV